MNPDLEEHATTACAPDGAKGDADARPQASQADKVLQAHALLAGRTWVGIEHNGQHYRLQTTRAGKLILTK